MSPELTRITELENTIENLVSYLRRLPAHVETYRQANEAEAVLTGVRHLSILEGGLYAPSGVLIIAGRLEGRKLTVKTQDIDSIREDIAQEKRNELYRCLKNGATFELKIEPVQPQRDFFVE